MSKVRLYMIGLIMGIADLIPGVSGGTIAFISGIYEELLESIKSLQLQSFKKIAWPFLLPLGGGIVTSILVFSRLMYFLLQHYSAPLFGFFFGLIAASTLICARSAHLQRPPHWIALAVGAALSFGLTALPCQQLFETHFLWIVLAGMLGVGAMLLPGISGSYILQIIGVYPLVIYALNSPGAPGSLKLLIAIGIGISLGFIVFSRLISLLLAYFHHITMAALVGFMVGGLKVLWPFGMGPILWPILCLGAGFFAIILLEISMKRLRGASGASN